MAIFKYEFIPVADMHFNFYRVDWLHHIVIDLDVYGHKGRQYESGHIMRQGNGTNFKKFTANLI